MTNLLKFAITFLLTILILVPIFTLGNYTSRTVYNGDWWLLEPDYVQGNDYSFYWYRSIGINRRVSDEVILGLTKDMLRWNRAGKFPHTEILIYISEGSTPDNIEAKITIKSMSYFSKEFDDQ